MYLARPGTAAVPRQKRGGLFCSVEGAFESKTLDFGALRVGQRRAPPPARPGPELGPGPEPGSAPGPDSDAGELRAAAGEERLQDLAPADDTVGAGGAGAPGPVRDAGRRWGGSGRGARGRGAAGGVRPPLASGPVPEELQAARAALWSRRWASAPRLRLSAGSSCVSRREGRFVVVHRCAGRPHRLVTGSGLAER